MIDPAIFKANDIRGIVGGPRAQWDAEAAQQIGAAYVEVLGLRGKEFVLGRDMRTSGVELSEAFIAGATARGANVVRIGLASTDELWFASGYLHLPGVQFTASHNPADYNGIKFCLADALPIPVATLASIRQLAGTVAGEVTGTGTVRDLELLDAYGEYLRSLVDIEEIRRLTVVVDAGNGMAGYTTPAVLGSLNLDLIGLHMELDGTFPNHAPNPLIPENLVDLQRAVVASGADVGLAFDGDADRCMIIDEKGEVVSPSTITALIAHRELLREPGATIVVNAITSATVAEVVAENGGHLQVSKVGHTSVKALMAEHNAIFGGEHSAHYYFRDFWGADTGMLAGLHILAMLGEREVSMSQLARQYQRYAASGELNSIVKDVAAVTDLVAQRFADRGTADYVDGLTVRGDGWWFNVRPSNTEPLLRLNVEARSLETMTAIRDEVLALIREDV